MAKQVQYGIKDSLPKRVITGTLDIENMSVEMCEEGTDTIQGVFEKFDGKLVKITIEEQENVSKTKE